MNAAPIFPVILLLLGGIGITFAGRRVGASRLADLSWLVLVGAFVACGRLWGVRLSAFDLISSDLPGQFLSLLVLAGLAGTLPLVRTALLRDQVEERLAPTIYGSALVAAAGGLVIVSTRNLGVMFVAVELICICHRLFSVDPKEGKSLVTLPSGISALALILSLIGFWISTGHLDVASIETVLLTTDGHLWLPKIAMWIFIIGLTLKMVAMHFDGQRTRSAALALTATMQVAVVGAVLRVTSWSLVLEDSWQFLLGCLAVVSFSVGSFLLVRGHGRWSYAQLGQIGAILLGLTVGGEAGRSSVLFYLFAFVLMSVGAIGAAVSLGSHESDFVSNGRIVAWRHPVLAGAMGVLLFSLAGIPPTIGFWSRFNVYLAAVYDGFFILLAFALLNMLIGIYYYLRSLTEIWMDSPSPSQEPHPVAIGVKLYILASVGVVLALGLQPEFLLALTKRVALELF